MRRREFVSTRCRSGSVVAGRPGPTPLEIATGRLSLGSLTAAGPPRLWRRSVCAFRNLDTLTARALSLSSDGPRENVIVCPARGGTCQLEG